MPSIKFVTKLYSMIGSGELDVFGPVAELLIATLYKYPSNGHLAAVARSGQGPTMDELQAFLEDDEKIRLVLRRLIAMIVQLPIWEHVQGELREDGIPDAAAEDIAEDCKAGAEMWLRDLRAFVEFVPGYKKEMASSAAQVASLALADAGASPIPPPGEGAGTPCPAPSPGKVASTKCGCGKPATSLFFGFQICDECLAGAQQLLKRGMGGKS